MLGGMPRPPRRPGDPPATVTPLPRATRARPTAEEIARAAVAKRPSPLGQPDKVELPLRLVLSRTAFERLTARAIRQGRKVEALIEELLETAGEP